MPPAEQLLENLHRAANDAFALAVFWHAWIALGVLTVWLGSVTARRVGQMLAVLAASVTGVAFVFGNPFNGAVFGVLTLVLVAAVVKMPAVPVQAGPLWAVICGAVLMALGWAYPEFIEPPWRWLYGAPLGILPCPTLFMLVGATLFLGGLGSRAWTLSLAGVGLFYGVIGSTRLGVQVDGALALGSAMLGTFALLPARPMPRRRAAR